jgi:diacylglycerol kinase (ATP)
LWSFAGLSYAFKHELAFRLELLAAVFLLPLSFVIAQDLSQLLWLIFTIALVLIVELVNSAIEATIDRISTQQHKLSKAAKDIGSAAVFCAIALLVIVWGLIICY